MMAVVAPGSSEVVPTLVIAPMGEAHLPEVLAIERASFPVPWDEATFASELGHAWSLCRVALSPEGAVLGYIVFWSVADELELLQVAADPARRGHGIGRALVAHMLDYGRNANARLVTLEVRRSNVAAIALYERTGFATIAVRARYYADNGEDALVMQRPLAAATEAS